MAKGLPKSLKHADKVVPVTKHISISGTISPTGSTGVAVGESAVIGDFPAGNILFLGAVAYVAFTGSGSDANLSDTWSGDFAVGTAAANDGALTGAGEANLVASTALAAATSEAIARTRGVTGTDATDGGLLAPLLLDNTDGSLELNLNLIVDANDITNAETSAITATGDIWLTYTVLGDD